MLRCRNCHAWLAPNAEACPRCGASTAVPDAPGYRNPVLVFFAFFAIGLIVFAWIFDLPEKSARAPRPADAVTAPAVPERGAVPLPEAAPLAADTPAPAEDTPAAEPPATDGFPYDATLTDPDGVVVLQSKATMFSRNVAKLASGTRVRAARRSGEWIRVKTQEGRVGYVRRRQLVFR